MNIIDVHTEATTAAKKAVADFLDRWNTQTGGNEYGEPMYCGFAWVDVAVDRTNSKEAKALASVKLLTGHPAGIGDHSTKDYWDNCTEALKLLASAEERLEVLDKYFNNKEQVNG